MAAFNLKRANKSQETIHDIFFYPPFEETLLGSLLLGRRFLSLYR